MTEWKRVEMLPVELPLDYGRIHSYDVQNMLLKQVNFPCAVHVTLDFGDTGDWVGDCYEDRAYDAWRKAWDAAPRGFIHEMSDDVFLKFVTDFFEAQGIARKITGARAVRYTNVSSGYPCIRIDAVVKHPDTPIEAPMPIPGRRFAFSHLDPNYHL